MAARENQGLQIALIIFVVLTISLLVSTVVYFKGYEEETKKAADAIKAKDTADKAARVAIDESRELKTLIGIDGKEALTAAQELAKKDMELFGKEFLEAKQYRSLVKYLVLQKRAADGVAIDLAVKVKELEDKIKADEQAKTTEIAQYQTGQEAAKGDLKGEREKFDKSRGEMTTASSEYAKKLDEKRKEQEEEHKKHQSEVSGLASKLTKLTKVNEGLIAKESQEVASNELPDGKITWVNQRARVVWINIGSSDRVKTQTSFSVIGPDEGNLAKAKKKGSVEVVRITGPHICEARILDDEVSDPIMPGDQVFSPIWQPGRIEHFALIGFMDIDGDKLSDRKKIRDLILQNGGKIDAEVTDDGKKIGEMTVETKYLVKGTQPTEKGSADLLKSYSAMIAEAASLGIRTISVQQFLDDMGYEPEDRTIALGRNAISDDFKAHHPDGVKRKSTGSTFDFKPRRPAKPVTPY